MNKIERSEKEQKYLIDAIDAFNRKLLIISPDFKIIAANNTAMEGHSESIIGKPCHEIILGCGEPCTNCPANEVMQTGKASIRYDQSYHLAGNEELLCLFSYPVYRKDEIDALVMLDFDLKALKTHGPPKWRQVSSASGKQSL